MVATLDTMKPVLKRNYFEGKGGKMSTLSQRRVAREMYKRVVKKFKPGTGARFAAIQRVIRLSGAKNPAAVAAAIGRKKYGAKRFARMAAIGRMRRRGR